MQIGLLAAYLGVAPVRWLPGVDAAFWSFGKFALFVAAVGLAFSCVVRRGRARTFRLPAGLAGPLGFAALGMLSVPGMVQAPEYARAASFLMDLAYGAAFAWCFYNIARTDQRAAQRILAGGTTLFAGFVAVAVALRLEGSFNSAAGCGAQNFRTAAFGCGSTSWSIAMAVYAALPLVFALRRDLAWDNRIFYAGLFLLFFAAAAIAGGRGGLLSLAATSAVLLLVLLPGWIKRAAALAAAALAALAVALPGGVAWPQEDALLAAGASAQWASEEQATPLQQVLLHFHLERWGRCRCARHPGPTGPSLP